MLVLLLLSTFLDVIVSRGCYWLPQSNAQIDLAKSKAHWSMGTAQFPNEPMGAFGNWALPMLQWAFVDVVVFGC